MVFKPLVAALFFCVAYAIAVLLWKVIPDGKIKRILYSPLSKRYPPRRTHWNRQDAQEVVVESPEKPAARRRLL